MVNPSDLDTELSLPAALLNYFSFPFRVEERLVEGGPALCLGWCTEADAGLRWAQHPKAPVAVAREPAFPNVLLSFEHQFGGYCCRQMKYLGVLFPIGGNARRLTHSDEIIRACDLMGTDGRTRVVERQLTDIAPVLERSWLTSGAEFDDAQLAEWNTLLARWLPSLAPALRGCEAAIELAHADPSLFERWQALSVHADRHAVQLLRAQPFSREHGQALQGVGHGLGLGAPRLWLLWDNSD